MRHHCHPLATPAPCTGVGVITRSLFPNPSSLSDPKLKLIFQFVLSLTLFLCLTQSPAFLKVHLHQVLRSVGWMSCSSSGVNPACEWVGDVTSCYDPQGLPTQCEEGNTEKPTEETEIKVSGRITRFYTDCVVLEYTGKLITCKF